MAKKSKKKKRQAQQSKPRRRNTSRSWLAAAFFLLLGSVLLILALFFWVDRKVLKSLRDRGPDRISSVVSAPLIISAARPPTTKAVRSYLEERHYREAGEKIALPGDYILSADRLQIFTREFRDAHNNSVPAQKASIDLSTGEITLTERPGQKSSKLLLEPKIISNLGSGEQRASNYKRLSDIPEHVKNAVIALEDERFYRHYGIDPIGILRAMIENIKALSFVQGGSTITQQLAKNILFTPEKTIGRKVLELMAAFSLERHLTKDQILEMYLNEIYLGQEGSFALHGIAEAGNAFFGKAVRDLNVAEGAMLASIIRAPSFYSPRKHLARALERKELALEKMYNLGFLDRKQLEAARLSKIEVIEEARNKRGAPHFTTALENDLAKQINLEAAIFAGLTVYTGLNNEFQACAEKTLPESLAELEKRYPKLTGKKDALEAALVAIEPHTGLIKAWVGGRNFSTNQFNHVIQAERQVGSTIKPFVYLTALDGSLNNYKVATATSILADEPTTIDLKNSKDWTPDNYDHSYRGDVTLRYALENSLNLPAVYLSQKVGIQSVVKALSHFRIADNIPAVPSLALGALDTNLLRLTAAYAALANGGRYVAPRLYVSAVNSDGEIVSASRIDEQQVADEAAVFVLTNILQGVIERGTARSVRASGYARPAAGKTGTSNETRDGWFVGFTPSLATGVWVGFDDNSKLGLTGGSLAAPIWSAFMRCIEPFDEALDFIKPPGAIFVNIDRETMDLATDQCPAGNIVSEIYVTGSEPSIKCRAHYRYPEDVIPRNEAGEDDIAPQRRRESLWDRIFG